MVMTIRMPKELYERLKETAQGMGMSMNAYVLWILWDCMKKQQAVLTE